MITGKKILITGATGQVARPIAESLARDNEVWCTARFTDPELKRQLEAKGMRTYRWDLGSNDLSGLPTDFNYIIHSAWIFTLGNDYEAAITSNVEGTGLIMAHCRNAEAFLFVSSLVVYKNRDRSHLYKEGREGYVCDYGLNPTYSVSKVAGESVVRTLCRIFSIPSTIARLGMAYGIFGHGGRQTQVFRKILAGEPIYISSRPRAASVIHDDDLVRNIEPLLGAAAVPSAIINWSSDEVVDELEMYRYIGKLAGIEPNFIVDEAKAGLIFAGDPAVRRAITGPSRVDWQEGLRRTLRARFPEHKFADLV